MESFVSKRLGLEDGRSVENEVRKYVKCVQDSTCWRRYGGCLIIIIIIVTWELFLSVSFPKVSVFTSVLLMALYPDVQSRAPQSQIDQLISQVDDSLSQVCHILLPYNEVQLRLQVRSYSFYCDYI